MRLTSLKLQNFCIHRSLFWELPLGLVGIVGPNGSGKSGAVNLGAFAGLTGDYSRHAQGKEGCICQQMGEKELSFIEICGEQEGVPFKLYRGLNRPKQSLEIAGQPPITRAAEIEAELTNRLGISRQTIDEYVFIGQQDLFAFVDMTPAVRAKSLSRLCGTSHAEKCWDAVGAVIAADAPLVAAVLNNRDELMRAWEEAKQRQGELRGQCNDLRAQLLSPEASLSFQAQVEKSQRHSRCVSQRELAAASEAEVLAEAKRLRKVYLAAADRYKEARADLDELRPAHDAAKTMLSQLAEQSRRWQEKTKWAKKVEALTADDTGIVDPDPPEGDSLDTVSEELLDAAATLAHDKLVLDVSGEVACPTCGRPVAAMQEEIDEARAKMPEHQRLVTLLQKRRKQWEEYERAVRQCQTRRATVASALATAKEALSGYVDAQPADANAATTATEVVARFRQAEVTEEMARGAEDAANRQQNNAIAQHKAKKQRLDELDAELAETAIEPGEVEIAQTVLKEDGLRRTELASLKGRLAEAELAVKRSEAAVQNLDARQKQYDCATTWLAALRRARDIFHRDNLPAAVHRAAIAEMEGEINDTLDFFDSPFFVEANDSLGFTAHFRNGTTVPAEALSGGQKVMLAVAFRMTVNSIFAANVGMMVLDEPTDGLDNYNRERAADVFRRLGEKAKQLGSQVIIVTHDETLLPAFDHVLHLDRVT